MNNIILLYKNGTTLLKTLNSCTNIDGIDISKNITAKTARERFNDDLQAYIFTEDQYNTEMAYAQKHPLF